MKKVIRDFFKIERITAFKILILILVYTLIRDIVPDIPYINLLTKDLSGKLTALWVVSVILFRPSANKLLILSGIILIVNLLYLLWTKSDSESFGLIIYVSLIFFVYKLLTKKN